MRYTMKLTIFCLLIAQGCFAQLSVDTTKGRTVVTNKVGGVVKTLSIYTSYAQPKVKQQQVVYLPENADYADETNTMRLSFATESATLKTMLDAAAKNKNYNFYRLSFNVVPYKDLMGKLADVYANSAEWNDYLKKAGDLHRVYKLDDGNEVTEVGYDPAKALAVMNKSDFMQGINAIFSTYGYQATSAGFPEDHQVILTPDQLRLLGKSETLFVPVPGMFFTLTKIKK